MKAVNTATQIVIDMFKAKADEVPFDGHPYHGLLKGLSALKQTEWDENHKREAKNALAMWVANILGGCVSGTMNEILALIKFAEKGDEEGQKAASEMKGSMGFLDKIVLFFLNSVDIEHVSEFMFEHGKNRHEQETKPKPAPEVKQIQNWMPTRWSPSAN